MLRSLSALSLLLCVASVGLWARSYWRYDVLSHFSARTLRNPEELDFMSCGWGTIGLGRNVVVVTSSNVGLSNAVGWNLLTLRDPGRFQPKIPKSAGFEWGGLGWTHWTNSVGPGLPLIEHRTLLLPCWVLVLLFAILPIVWSRSELRRRRVKVGLCRVCGYDLRATPDRCPECGTVPEHRSAVSVH